MLPALSRLRLSPPTFPTSGLLDSLLGKRDAPEEEGEEEEEVLAPLKLLILDFDLTMTVTVVERGKRPPLRNVTSDKLNVFKSLTKQEHIKNFGGPERVERMQQLFQEVLDNGTELRILSYGKKEAIVIALEAAGLADYFTEQDEELGNLVFGNDVPPLNADDAYKAIVIQEWMDALDLKPDEVAFLDDDRENIDAPEKGEDNVGVAQILHPGHAHLHPIDYFEASEPWIREICGLPPRVEAAGPSSA